MIHRLLYALFYLADIINRLISLLFRAERRRRNNYIYNMKISGNEKVLQRGYIGNQTRMYMYRFGICPFDFNGCGAVALYNIMYFHGKADSFVKMLCRLEKTVLALGYLGSSPVAMMHFLEKYGFSVTLVSTKENIYKLREKDSCLIHYFIRKDFSAHCVAGLPRGDGKFFFYNGTVAPDHALKPAEYIAATEKRNHELKHDVALNCIFVVKAGQRQN